MAFSGRRNYRTAASIAAFVAFILVLIFGSPWYRDWADDANRGVFLTTLGWPAWWIDDDVPLRDLLAASLKAILLIVFTFGFVTLMAGSQLSRARGGVSSFLVGWAAYIFAAALAALIAAAIVTDPGPGGAVEAAADGARYGLIVGWIVGLASMAGRRP
jgi:uncharacterized membrane protein YdjX (TVP38/TMEM64 family)